MDRRAIEATATYLAVVLLGVLMLLSSVAVADGVFHWDILPDLLDRFAVWAMASLFIALGACVLVSVMLNVSIIASRISEIAERLPRE